MKKRLWLTAILICLAMVCACAFAAAEGTNNNGTPELWAAEYNEEFVNVDGSTVTVKLNQWVHFAARAPGANYISFHELAEEPDANTELNDSNAFGGDFQDPNDPESRVDCQWIGVGLNTTTTSYIVAQAHYFRDDEPEVTAVSNVITLNVECDGPISGDVTFTVPQDVNTLADGRYQVARDGRLFIDVNNMEGVDFFGAYIDEDETTDENPWLADSHWVHMSDGETTRVPLTVPRCEAGQEYTVKVFAIKFGAEQKNATATIPIRVTAAKNNSPVIVSMGDEFWTGEPLRVFAHYTNPDNLEDCAMVIRIHEKDNPEHEVYNDIGDIEDYWDDGSAIWESGIYVIDAYIFQYGQQVRAYEGIKEIRVNAHGCTAAPQTERFWTVPAGQDLEIELTAEPEGDEVMPEWFDYALHRMDWGFAFIDEGSSGEIGADGRGTITIPADRLEADGQYCIRLMSMKPEYDVGVTEIKFAVLKENQTTQHLTLTINGSAEAEQSELSCTDLRVKVSYGNADRPTAIRILNRENWEYMWDPEDNFERNWGFGEDEVIMYAEATWDSIDFDELDARHWEGFDWNRDVNWTERSNVIRLNNINPYGEMQAPEFTIEYEEMGLAEEAEIPWGDDLIINIADAQPKDTKGKVVGGGWFFFNIEAERVNNDGSTWWDHLNSDEYQIQGGVNRIPTYMLEGGVRYRFEIGADARGYAGRSRQAEFRLGEEPDQTGENVIRIFTVNGQSPTAEAHDFNATAGVDVQLAVYRSGAEWYRVEITRDGDNGWRDEVHDRGNGMLLEGWRPNQAGDYELIAIAYGHLRDEDGNIITDEQDRDFWEDPIGRATIHAAAEGDLGRPWVDMPMTANAGEEVRLTWHLDDRTEYYGYWISYEDEWDNLYGNRTHIDEIRRELDDEADTYDMVIPAGTLEANRVYHVYLDLEATGYNQGHDDRTLYVTGGAVTDGSITITGPETLVFSEYFPIEVHADGADEILVWWEAAGGWRGDEGGYAKQWYCQDWVPGEGQYYEDADGQRYIRFYAIARYGHELKVSPTLNIPYSTEDVEYAEAPELSIGNEGTIYRGDFIEAIVTGIDDPGVTEYKVFITDEDGSWVDFTSSQEAGTLLLPTNYLEAGREYRLQACATVPGKIRTDSDPIPFTIAEATETKFIVSKTQVEVCEPLTVSVVAPGAERIRFSGGYGNWWEYDGWEGDSWYSNDVRWDISEDPDIKICAEAWYPNAENWTPVGEAHIKVTARDSLRQPEVTMATTITAGQNLYITIGEVENAEFYRIELRRVDGNDREWYFDAEPGNENMIPGEILYEGGYRIRVTALAYGYNAGQIEQDLYVEPIRPEIRVNPVVSNSTSSVKIKVPLVENGTTYELAIHYVPADDPDNFEASYVYRKTLHDTDAVNGILTFTVAKNTLRNGMTHWIDCYVSGENGFFCENAKAVVVRNEQADGNITISVNGETGSEARVLIHDDFRVIAEVNTPEGEPEATAIKISCGDRYQYFFGNHAEAIFNEWQPYAETLYAQACYDALPEGNFEWESLTWSAPGNPVVVTFYAIGQVGKPGYFMPETVVRGDILTISNIYEGDHANETHANINRGTPWHEEEWVYQYGWHDWDPETRTIHLSTSMLEPGEYWVAVDNSGIGYTGNREWRMVTVTEREEQPEGSIILSMPEKVQAGLDIPVSVYAPGAIQVGFGIDLSSEEKTNPDHYRTMGGEIYYEMNGIRLEDTGAHTITACAQFAEGGAWTLLDQEIEICDPLRFDMSGMPGVFSVNQADAAITVPLPENAQRMSIQVNAEGDEYWERIYESQEDLYGDETIPIPAEYLQTGITIRVDFQAKADFFMDSNDGTVIPVTAAQSNKATLTVREGDINNVWANEEIEFLVTPAAGKTLTAVRFYSGTGWWEGGDAITPENHPDWFDNGSAFFRDNYNEEPNRVLTAFAEVKVAGSSAWTRTNTIQFTVKNEGYVGAYDFEDLSDITVQQGTVIEVTFQPAGGADHYWADAFSTWDGHRSRNPRTWNEEGTTTVRIHTAGMEPGVYELWGRAGGPRRLWTESDHYVKLTITEGIPSTPTAAFRTPDALTTIEEEAFAGIGAETVEISETVENIYNRAFADSRVKTVIIRNSETRIDYNAFDGCGHITVYSVPDTPVFWWAYDHGYTFYPIDGE